MREAFAGCDAIVHLAALKIPRYGGALKTLQVNVDGSHVAFERRRSSIGAHVVLASTSDVYGNARRRRSPRTTRSCSARRRRRRWSYADVEAATTSTSRCGWPRSEGLKVTILRFFNAYGARNHPTWWGGPLSVVLRGPARRPRDGAARRRPPGPLVHLRQRHGRRLRARARSARDRRARSSTSATTSRSRSSSSPQACRRRWASTGRCARRSCRSSRSAATTRTCASASPTPTKATRLLGFEPSRRAGGGPAEDPRLAPRCSVRRLSRSPACREPGVAPRPLAALGAASASGSAPAAPAGGRSRPTRR